MAISLALILSFVESQIPPLVAVPGVKVGLPNLVMIFLLYRVGVKETAIVSILRVLLVGMLFGSALSMMYALAGAFLSLTGMSLLKCFTPLSCVTVSVVGGILHNIGQITVAYFVTDTAAILLHLPALLISGTIAGVIIGVVGGMLVQRLSKIRF